MTAVNDDLDKIARDEADLAARKARLGVDQPESPTVIDVDADGNVTAPSTAVVVPDEPEPWPHEVLRDFYGEDWEVRQPSEQALAAFALSSGKYIPQKLQNPPDQKPSVQKLPVVTGVAWVIVAVVEIASAAVPLIIPGAEPVEVSVATVDIETDATPDIDPGGAGSPLPNQPPSHVPSQLNIV